MERYSLNIGTGREYVSVDGGETWRRVGTAQPPRSNVPDGIWCELPPPAERAAAYLVAVRELELVRIVAAARADLAERVARRADLGASATAADVAHADRMVEDNRAGVAEAEAMLAAFVAEHAP